jgi:hypothetical protein
MKITEEAAQLRITQQLIRRYGRDIALIRPGSWVSDGAGGRVRSGDATYLPPVRRFFSGSVQNNVFTVNFQGERQNGRFVLLGLPGDDIQQGDFWEDGATQYRVTHVHDNPRYEVRAEVLGIGT